ncbi:MAG TPA: hypothetical protein VEH30_11655 [Terriglobales bacterium]|nr:hypothetical protein [Terriglobales bacterium]
MLKQKKWLLTLLAILAMAVITVPVMAGTNDANTANGNAASATSAEASPAAPSPILTSTTVDANVSTSSPESEASSQAAMPAPPPPPAVVPAIVPIRVFPVDPPKTGGLVGVKVGPITVAPYGFIKATVVHDSSDPDGDDQPGPGLFFYASSVTNTGPTKDPEFHIKARSTRFGLNIEWPDASKNLTFTGKIEGDFEGNFNESSNSDVTSIRSYNPRVRLAFVRMDYHASETTDIFFVGGQDWSPFGSGALPSLLETTTLGGFYGSAYTRTPQLRVGWIQTLSKEYKINFEPDFAIMMPSSGQVERLGTSFSNGLQNQIGQAEREGADSDRPEYAGRVALSYQLDKAPGVAPAQIALSGFYGKRRSIVTTANGASSFSLNAPNAAETAYLTANNGFEASSKQYGGQITLQAPTRWFTLTASAYRGGDLRFYAADQINTYFTNTAGLTNPVIYTTQDGGPYLVAGGAVLGVNAAGNVVVAPQSPVRCFGGFVNLGLPLSRWFNANPKGHNAGWQLFFNVGKDQIVDRDLNNPGVTAAGNAGGLSPLPLSMGKLAAVTLYYKVNNWAQFGFEQSVYSARLLDHVNAYTIAGVASNEWQDHRTEFGPIFTF